MIPRGQVATYGQIAAIVSHRGAARTVGWALHGLVEGTDVPWHRVINARGQISLEPGTRQVLLLREEGVIVNAQGQVDMKRFQWPGLDWPEIEAYDISGERLLANPAHPLTEITAEHCPAFDPEEFAAEMSGKETIR